ncbi:hypothetical protein M4D81_13510 [Paenibacillus sp. p3-SID867]|uniref:hypothetical protein n=1 Tax=Paenibacillus sp. p3-SID867 TaxID=2916363 RepID=UPI0021A43E3F|nr:hypothetical protein [Paenibacillus sp. p3-SID867]MCT1400043.1 hypothetical protein [Paenibacillus sp. p3-SID867]
MHISQQLKAKLNDVLGFELIWNTKNSPDFGSLLNAINIDEAVQQEFETIPIDDKKVSQALKEQALHQWRQEIINEILQSDYIDILQEYQNEYIDADDELTFGDLLDDLFITNAEDFSQLYGDRITDSFKRDVSIHKDIVQLFNKESKSGYLKKEGSISLLFFIITQRYKIPTTKISSRRNNSDYFPLLNTAEIFFDILGKVKDEMNIVQDSIQFEKKTNLIYTFQAASFLDKANRKNEKKIIKAISTFSLLDDLGLKFYLIENFDWYFDHSLSSTSTLFKWKYIIVPCLVEFLKMNFELDNKRYSTEGELAADSTDIKIQRIKKIGRLYFALEDRSTNEKILSIADKVFLEGRKIKNSDNFLKVTRSLEKIKKSLKASETDFESPFEKVTYDGKDIVQLLVFEGASKYLSSINLD